MEGKHVVSRATIKPQKSVVTEEVSDQPLPSLPITREPTISSPPKVHRTEPLAQGSSSATPFRAQDCSINSKAEHLVYPKAGATAVWHFSLCKGQEHMLQD